MHHSLRRLTLWFVAVLGRVYLWKHMEVIKFFVVNMSFPGCICDSGGFFFNYLMASTVETTQIHKANCYQNLSYNQPHLLLLLDCAIRLHMQLFH